MKEKIVKLKHGKEKSINLTKLKNTIKQWWINWKKHLQQLDYILKVKEVTEKMDRTPEQRIPMTVDLYAWRLIYFVYYFLQSLEQLAHISLSPTYVHIHVCVFIYTYME